MKVELEILKNLTIEQQMEVGKLLADISNYAEVKAYCDNRDMLLASLIHLKANKMSFDICDGRPTLREMGKHLPG